MKGGKKGRDTSMLLSIGSDCHLLFSILFTCDSHLQYFLLQFLRNPIRNNIGQNIAYFRIQKKMTQEELAEKMSVTAQAVSKWECDTSYPDITAIKTLSKVLGVTPTELINGIQHSAEIKDASQEMIDRRIVCIEVQVDETKIVTRFPVPVIKKAMENGTLESLVGKDAYSQVVGILEMIDSGITGRLVDVNSPEVQTTITVENYED